MNSAVEYLADRISREQDPLIGKAKDIAAAAVLWSSIGTFIIGLLIFLPKLGII
jgi:diacylglycerol kinase